MTDWHMLTQLERNQAIVDATLPDMGTKGGQCKIWVQSLVHRVSASYGSSGAVQLPRNKPSPEEYMWYPGPNVVGLCAPLESASLGWIIQMRIKEAHAPSIADPHTAIVIGSTSKHQIWADSNWVAKETVGTHIMPYEKFYKTLYGAGEYSLYYVL